MQDQIAIQAGEFGNRIIEIVPTDLAAGYLGALGAAAAIAVYAGLSREQLMQVFQLVLEDVY